MICSSLFLVHSGKLVLIVFSIWYYNIPIGISYNNIFKMALNWFFRASVRTILRSNLRLSFIISEETIWAAKGFSANMKSFLNALFSYFYSRFPSWSYWISYSQINNFMKQLSFSFFFPSVFDRKYGISGKKRTVLNRISKYKLCASKE